MSLDDDWYADTAADNQLQQGIVAEPKRCGNELHLTAKNNFAEECDGNCKFPAYLNWDILIASVVKKKSKVILMISWWSRIAFWLFHWQVFVTFALLVKFWDIAKLLKQWVQNVNWSVGL